jgi:hypothetical protein
VRTLIIVLVVLIAIILAVPVSVGLIARSVVETAGPKVLGVPIHLTSASFNPLQGRVTIKGFTMGNPAGFRSDESVGVGSATVDVKLTSLFKDPLVIDRIHVSNPRLTYELNLGSSNLQKIQECAASKVPAPGGTEKPGRQKKVIIRDLLVEKAQARVVLGSAGGAGATVPLPTIHLTNVGQDTGGAAVADIVGQVLHQVVSSIGGLAGNVGGAVIDAAQNGKEAVQGAAAKAMDKVGGILHRGKKD